MTTSKFHKHFGKFQAIFRENDRDEDINDLVRNFAKRAFLKHEGLKLEFSEICDLVGVSNSKEFLKNLLFK